MTSASHVLWVQKATSLHQWRIQPLFATGRTVPYRCTAARLQGGFRASIQLLAPTWRLSTRPSRPTLLQNGFAHCHDPVRPRSARVPPIWFLQPRHPGVCRALPHRSSVALGEVDGKNRSCGPRHLADFFSLGASPNFRHFWQLCNWP